MNKIKQESKHIIILVILLEHRTLGLSYVQPVS